MKKIRDAQLARILLGPYLPDRYGRSKTAKHPGGITIPAEDLRHALDFDGDDLLADLPFIEIEGRSDKRRRLFYKGDIR